MNVVTTLNAIWQCIPCSQGWQTLLKHLCKKEPDNAPLPLCTVLESNGLADALWCLRTVAGIDRECRLYAVWCARQIEHLLKDARSIEALIIAERFAIGAEAEKQRDRAMLLAAGAEDAIVLGSEPWEWEACAAVTAACWKNAGWLSHAARRATTAYAMAAGQQAEKSYRANYNAALAAEVPPRYAGAEFPVPVQCFAEAFNTARSEMEARQTAKFREMFCTDEHKEVGDEHRDDAQ